MAAPSLNRSSSKPSVKNNLCQDDFNEADLGCPLRQKIKYLYQHNNVEHRK